LIGSRIESERGGAGWEGIEVIQASSSVAEGVIDSQLQDLHFASIRVNPRLLALLMQRPLNLREARRDRDAIFSQFSLKDEKTIAIASGTRRDWTDRVYIRCNMRPPV